MRETQSQIPTEDGKSGKNREELNGPREQVAQDLLTKLDEYSDPKKGLRVMAALMGIHEKTLKRLIDCKNSPHYQTLFKIYRVIHPSKSDSELIKLVPPVIKQAMLKGDPRGIQNEVNYTIDVEKELLKDPIFCSIYAFAGAGGVTKEYISFQYGRYGEEVLEKMIHQKVLAQVDKHSFILGTNQATLSPETIKRFGLLLIENFSKPENSDEKGDNYQTLYINNLSEEAYNAWIKIDENAFREKLKLAKRPENRGPIKAFTVSTIDTLRPSNKTLKH